MVFPKPLVHRSGVAVVAPASFVQEDIIEKGLDIVEGWGLRIYRGASLYGRSGQYSGTDAVRLRDMQWALDHPDVEAIIMARGGYGVTRLLDSLDFSGFLQNPKWVVGFSDITGLHCHLHNLGCASIHGPMPGYYARPGAAASAQNLRDLLFGSRPPLVVAHHDENRFGTGTGMLTGGNLSLLCHLAGSASEPNTNGRILFLEDVGEYRYNVDRMFVQLKRSGKLERLAGLIIGAFTDLKDPRNPLGTDLEGIVRDHTAVYDYPVAFGFPIGHRNDNRPLVLGAEVRLEVGPQASTLTYVKTPDQPEVPPV